MLVAEHVIQDQISSCEFSIANRCKNVSLCKFHACVSMYVARHCCDHEVTTDATGRDSSVGRASDRRSEGPRFDPGSRHFCFVSLICPSAVGSEVGLFLGCGVCMFGPVARVLRNCDARMSSYEGSGFATPESSLTVWRCGRFVAASEKSSKHADQNKRPRADLNRDRWIQSPEC